MHSFVARGTIFDYHVCRHTLKYVPCSTYLCNAVPYLTIKHPPWGLMTQSVKPLMTENQYGGVKEMTQCDNG